MTKTHYLFGISIVSLKKNSWQLIALEIFTNFQTIKIHPPWGVQLPIEKESPINK